AAGRPPHPEEASVTARPSAVGPLVSERGGARSCWLRWADRKQRMRMTRAWLALAAAFLISTPLAENASAARHHHHAAAAPRGHPTAAQKKAPAIDQNVLQAEVLLDRAGFSPGVIDGRDGDNFAKALHAFQQVNGLQVGPLDQATLEKLSQAGGGPAVSEYTIQPQDVAGPFVAEIPRQFVEMAQLPQL